MIDPVHETQLLRLSDLKAPHADGFSLAEARSVLGEDPTPVIRDMVARGRLTPTARGWMKVRAEGPPIQGTKRAVVMAHVGGAL